MRLVDRCDEITRLIDNALGGGPGRPRSAAGPPGGSGLTNGDGPVGDRPRRMPVPPPRTLVARPGRRPR